MNIPDDRRLPPRPPADQATQRSYALSGRIMLSAIIVLFAVVVFMLILHIYARWYLLRARRRRGRHHRRGRRTHLVFYVEPTNPAAASLFSFPQRGLDPLLLKSLPTFTFTSPSKSAAVEEENALECAVCLSEFEEGELGRRLPKCDHSFHVDCIDMWFHSHSTCPLCRAPVDGDLDSPVKGGENVPPEIVVDLTESTRSTLASSELDAESRPGPSSSLSFGGRRKEMDVDLVGVSIEVPARSASFSFSNSDEFGPSSPAGQGFKSPTSRLLSLKRMLSREKKPISIPSSPSCSGIGTSCSELSEFEEGRVETRASEARPQAPM